MVIGKIIIFSCLSHYCSLAAEQWECEYVYLCEGEKMSEWICGRTKE